MFVPGIWIPVACTCYRSNPAASPLSVLVVYLLLDVFTCSPPSSPLHLFTCSCCLVTYAVVYLFLLLTVLFTCSPSLQSSLAQLGIPFTDVVKVLVAILLLGNILFFEAKNQELSVQGVEGMLAVVTRIMVSITRKQMSRKQNANA